ncbi:MAG: hypothetical protein ABIR66_06890 [Saprospiraceae bacterium]
MKWIIIFLFTLSFFACNDANPRAIKSWLNSSDTLVQQMMMKEQPTLDSICKANNETFYRIAYDSIYQRRSEEIKLLLDSIPGHEGNR